MQRVEGFFFFGGGGGVLYAFLFFINDGLTAMVAVVGVAVT